MTTRQTPDASPYVAGPIWAEPEDDCFTTEIQTVGGHSVIATVHGNTRDEAEQRQLAILAALDSRAGDAGEGFIVKLDNWMTVSVEDGGLILRNEAGEPIAFGKLGPDAKLPATAAPEPFGYWVEHKHADPVLLRKPAYIPEPSDLRTVTPLYAAPAVDAVPAGEEWPKIVRDMLDGVKGARDRARAALSHGEGRE